MELQAFAPDVVTPPTGLFWTRKVRKSGAEVFYHYAWRGGPLVARSNQKLSVEEHARLALKARTREAIPVGALDDILDGLFSAAKKRATHDGRDFSITRDELSRIAQRQGWRCAVSGIEFSHDKARDHFRSPWRPSLDRIDASRGYVPGNVRLVLVAVNIAMGEWGEKVFLQIAHATASRC